MAYIEPNSTVVLLAGVPLDNGYEHTIYFANAAEQVEYFTSNATSSISKIFLTNQMYKRYDRSSLKVALESDRILGYNYMAFKNTSYPSPGDRWFYAFITDIEHVGVGTSRIYYELDVMQTFYFDYELMPCFVEREHSATDGLFENTLPEQLETGEYECTELERPTCEYDPGEGALPETIKLFDDFVYVVASTAQPDPRGVTEGVIKADPVLYSGILNGVYCYAVPASFNGVEVVGATALVKQYVDQITNAGMIDGIVSVFMMPLAFWKDSSTTYVEPASFDFSFTNLMSRTYYLPDGTEKTIKNNKLFTYPYHCMSVQTSDGSEATLRYEYFNKLPADTPSTFTAYFNAKGTAGSKCDIRVTPKLYKRQVEAVNDSIHFTTDMQCSVNSDTFKAWLAQNKGKLILSAAHDLPMLAAGASNLISGGAALAAGQEAWMGAATRQGMAAAERQMSAGSQSITRGAIYTNNSVGGIMDMLNEVYVASIQPNRNHGQVTCGIDVGLRQYGYRFYSCKIRGEYIQIIDDFFTRYGYACHRLKVPNTHVRQYFTYTKTRGCEIKAANINDVFMKKIKSIYDNGITFWDGTVGDYDVDNSPLI